MKKQLIAPIVLIALLAILATGCKSKETGPLEAYQAYWEACEASQFATAKQYLAEEAQAKTDALGICGFTHDAINTILAASGDELRTFSEAPEVSIQEDFGTAGITWFDDQGNIAQVALVKVDGNWKIIESQWSR